MSLMKKFPANGMTRRREGSRHAYRRRQQEDELVRSGRNNVFLEEELNAIGNGLEQAPRPHPHGAQLACMKERTFALHVDEVSHNPGQHGKHNQDLDDRQMSGWTSKKSIAFWAIALRQ